MIDDEIELDLAYISAYKRFIAWLEPYVEGQHDAAARNVYRVFASTEQGEGLFEAFCAGMKREAADIKQALRTETHKAPASHTT